MVEILSAIRENLIMVSAFLVPLILMRAADIILGVAISRRNSVAWDWKKFLWGLFYTICFAAGTGLFTMSISMIEPIIRVYNIVGDETTLTMLNGISVLAMCGIILTITVTSYGKDCFEKIKTLAGKEGK